MRKKKCGKQFLTEEQNKVFEENINLVYSFFHQNKWRVSEMLEEDLLQELLITYANACRLHNPKIERSFTSYVYQAFFHKINQLRVYVQRKHLGEDYSYDKICRVSDDNENMLTVYEATGMVKTYDPRPTSAEINNSYLVDLLMNHSSLTDKEREILKMYSQGMTWADIGRARGVSKQTIHKIGSAAFKRMRKTYENLNSVGRIL